MTPIFYIKEGNLSFADKVILSAIELYISPGDKICLIGKNGSGKSSLLKVIRGIYDLDNGEIFRDPVSTIGYLTQDIKNSTQMSIEDFVMEGVLDPDNNKYLADIVITELGIDGKMLLCNCSGGQVRRAYLAKVLVMQPSILLLDEPTNHLDISTIQWLEDYVKSYQGAVICISHDKAFLSNVTNKIWWLDRGELRKSDRGFKFFAEWQEQIIVQEEAALRKLNRKLEIESDWLQGGVTARRKRNQRRLAHLRRLRETVKQSAAKLSSAKHKLSAEMAEEIKKTKFIIEAENVSFAYENKLIVKDFSFRVIKGEKIGIIGANGSGKSTFIKLLTKELDPSTGKVKHGTNLDISYFDQCRTSLNPNESLKQVLCPTGGDQIFLSNGLTMHVAGYLKKFMFDPKLLNAKVSTLSGGEANRLLLAKTLINPGNLLILDEPTNDLDMDSLEMLLDLLVDYSGTLLVVSHDRDFLANLATRTLVFNDGEIRDLLGGFEDYNNFDFAGENKGKIEIKRPIVKEVVPVRASSNKTEKLSYKDKRLLEILPSQIESLEIKISNLEKELSNSELYLANPEKYQQLTKDLEEAKKEHITLLEKWISLGDTQLI
jgi:ATP-binding cassette subfamily F protein uup